MKLAPATAICLALLFTACAPKGDADALSTSWRTLFNGKDLDGWYIFLQKHGRDSDPDRVITIEDGAIHAYKHAPHGSEVVMGYIGTHEQFSNYHLRLQYKWGKKQFKPRFLMKPDAGVYYHHITEDVVWPQALQFQVELNSLGDLLTVGHIKVDTTIDPANKSDEWQQYLPLQAGGVPYTTTGGPGATYTRRRENHERDGWNTIELICKGDSAVHIVNGHVVNHCTNIRRQDPANPNHWLPLTDGRILLEFEATEMYYRDVKIRNLAPDESLDQAIARAK